MGGSLGRRWGSRALWSKYFINSLALRFKVFVWTVSAEGDRSTNGGQRWTLCLSQAPSLPVLWQ